MSFVGCFFATGRQDVRFWAGFAETGGQTADGSARRGAHSGLAGRDGKKREAATVGRFRGRSFVESRAWRQLARFVHFADRRRG